MPYDLSGGIDKFSDDMINSYIGNGFVSNPIIAALVVTFITIFIIYISKTTDLTKIFVGASLLNCIYLFFHMKAVKVSIEKKLSTNNLVAEFANIKTNIGGGEEEFRGGENN